MVKHKILEVKFKTEKMMSFFQFFMVFLVMAKDYYKYAGSPLNFLIISGTIFTLSYFVYNKFIFHDEIEISTRQSRKEKIPGKKLLVRIQARICLECPVYDNYQC